MGGETLNCKGTEVEDALIVRRRVGDTSALSHQCR